MCNEYPDSKIIGGSSSMKNIFGSKISFCCWNRMEKEDKVLSIMQKYNNNNNCTRTTKKKNTQNGFGWVCSTSQTWTLDKCVLFHMHYRAQFKKYMYYRNCHISNVITWYSCVFDWVCVLTGVMVNAMDTTVYYSNCILLYSQYIMYNAV